MSDQSNDPTPAPNGDPDDYVPELRDLFDGVSRPCYVLPPGYTITQIMNNPDLIADQTLFHTTFRSPPSTVPHIPASEDQAVAHNLIYEEYREFSTAWDHCARTAKLASSTDDERAVHLASLLDGLVDLVYVCIQAANLYSLPFAEAWRLVQTANMSKLWTYSELSTLHPTWAPGVVIGGAYAGWTITPTDLPENVERRYIVKDEKRKVRKPPGWVAPDITALVRSKFISPKE